MKKGTVWMFLMLLVCILPPAALEKAGIGDRLAIRPEDGEDLLKNILLSDFDPETQAEILGTVRSWIQCE